MSQQRVTIGSCVKLSIIDANARDYLANERTLMSHTRTAFACIGLGVTISSTALTLNARNSAATGLVLVILGGLIFLYSTPRYYFNLLSIAQNSFALDYITPALFTVILLAAAVLSFVLVVTR